MNLHHFAPFHVTYSSGSILIAPFQDQNHEIEFRNQKALNYWESRFKTDLRLLRVSRLTKKRLMIVSVSRKNSRELDPPGEIARVIVFFRKCSLVALSSPVFIAKFQYDFAFVITT